MHSRERERESSTTLCRRLARARKETAPPFDPRPFSEKDFFFPFAPRVAHTHTHQIGAGAAFPGALSKRSLRSLRSEYRVVAALCPDERSYRAFSSGTAAPLQRRLAQARVLAVACCCDAAVALDAPTKTCASPDSPDAWRRAFAELAADEQDTAQEAWFALSFVKSPRLLLARASYSRRGDCGGGVSLSSE